MADPSYRQWLQGRANTGDTNALALLDVVGDDARVNSYFMGGQDNLVGSGYNFNPSQVSDLNTQYATGYSQYLEGYPTGLGDTAKTTNTTSFTGGSGGSGGSTAPTRDEAGILRYGQEIKTADTGLGLLAEALGVGLGNLTTSAGEQRAGAEGDWAKAQRDYDLQNRQTIQDRTSAVNVSRSNTANSLRSLQRLLGAAGSGTSSAALEAAPLLSARRGSKDLNSIQRTYGRNLQALDTAFGDTEESYLDTIANIGRAETIGKNNLRAENKRSKAGLFEDKAEAVVNQALAEGLSYGDALARGEQYRNTANTLLQEVINLGVLPEVPNVTPLQVATPDISNYDIAGRARIGGGPAASGVSPLLMGLLGEDERNKA